MLSMRRYVWANRRRTARWAGPGTWEWDEADVLGPTPMMSLNFARRMTKPDMWEASAVHVHGDRWEHIVVCFMLSVVNA